MELSWLASPWVFGSILVIGSLIGFAIYKFASVSISKRGIELSKGNKKVVLSPHATCPHARDIMDVIHRTIEYSEKRQELKNSLVERQMRYYEEIEEEMSAHFKRIFLSLLAEKVGQDILDSYAQHPEYTSYVVTLKAISSDIKPYIKGCFKSNHYSDQSPEDQRTYIDRKRSLVIQKVTELFNMYWRGTIVTRSALYKENMKNIREFEDYLEDIFNRAFLLARETKEELAKMEQDYNKYIVSVTG